MLVVSFRGIGFYQEINNLLNRQTKKTTTTTLTRHTRSVAAQQGANVHLPDKGYSRIE